MWSLRSKSFKILFKIFWLAPLLERFSFRFLSDFERSDPLAAFSLNHYLFAVVHVDAGGGELGLQAATVEGVYHASEPLTMNPES